MEASVKKRFDLYPAHIRHSMEVIRQVIFDVASEHGINEVEENLKWGEPSYTVKGGSPVRIDWKPKSPDRYAIYFNCNTSLVETFKEIYGNLFNYEGNRAIVFQVEDKIPMAEFRHCLSLSLRYHKIKHLNLLGA